MMHDRLHSLVSVEGESKKSGTPFPENTRSLLSGKDRLSRHTRPRDQGLAFGIFIAKFQGLFHRTEHSFFLYKS